MIPPTGPGSIPVVLDPQDRKILEVGREFHRTIYRRLIKLEREAENEDVAKKHEVFVAWIDEMLSLKWTLDESQYDPVERRLCRTFAELYEFRLEGDSGGVVEFMPIDVELESIARAFPRIPPPREVDWYFRAAVSDRVCEVCGCTDARACAGGCGWRTEAAAVGHSVCTACELPLAVNVEIADAAGDPDA